MKTMKDPGSLFSLCLLLLLSVAWTANAQDSVRDPLRPVAVSHTFGPPSQTATTVFYVDSAGLIRRMDVLSAVPGSDPSPVRSLSMADPMLLRRLELSREQDGTLQLLELTPEGRMPVGQLQIVGRSVENAVKPSGRTWTTRPDGSLGSIDVFNPSGELTIAVAFGAHEIDLTAPIAQHRHTWSRTTSGDFRFVEYFEEGELVWEAGVEATSPSAFQFRQYYPSTGHWGVLSRVEGIAPVTDAITAATNLSVLLTEQTVTIRTWPYIFAPHLATDEGVNVVTSSVFTEVLGGERVYYLGKNLLDDDPRTAWVEGHPGDGVGEWVDLLVPEVSSFHSLTVRNGFQANAEWYHKNCRVRGYRILVDEVEVHRGELPDRMGEQEITFAPVEGQVLRFEVTSIYEGTHYTDLVISDLSVGYQ